MMNVQDKRKDDKKEANIFFYYRPVLEMGNLHVVKVKICLKLCWKQIERNVVIIVENLSGMKGH